MLACAVSFIFAIFQVVEYGALLSVSEDKTPPVFLQLLYWLQLLFGVGTLLLSILTYVAIYTQHVRLMSGGCSMPLLFSRLLRYGLWLSLFAFFFVWFRSDVTCGILRTEGEEKIIVEACRCMKEGELESSAGNLDDFCKPKSYHVCESPLVDEIRSYELDSGTLSAEVVSQIHSCRWCGLNLDGDVDGDNVVDHAPCTPEDCLSKNCRYETKTCPSREEDFEDEMNEYVEAERALREGVDADLATFVFLQGPAQGIDECRYDDDGRLTSLNFTARFDRPDAQVDHYIDTGVLRLTHETDNGLEWVLQRGGMGHRKRRPHERVWRRAGKL